jgi:hypothetical protein
MSALVCTHARTGTLFNRAERRAFKADCGSRARCPAARARWSREMRSRMERVEFVRVPFLWTFTARTAEQDAVYQGRARGLSAEEARELHARGWLYGVADRGAVSRENLDIMRRGIERVIRALERQAARQRKPDYQRSRRARELLARYGTARVVRGRRGAALRIRVREAGEERGRLHSHAASDFDFLHYGWLNDTALRCGLGHVQFEAPDTRALQRAARASGPRVRSRSIGAYLSKYLAKGTDAGAWLWPRGARLVSAARGVLPPMEPKAGWMFTWRSVALTAIEELGAVCVDADTVSYRPEPSARLLEGRGPPNSSCPAA